jgi:hypothetical protein
MVVVVWAVMVWVVMVWAVMVMVWTVMVVVEVLVRCKTFYDWWVPYIQRMRYH